MADVKISELTPNASPSTNDVAAVSNSASSATNKVELLKIAQLFSQPTGISGASSITNVVRISQTNYNSLVTASTTDASTLYIIES